MKEQLLFVDIVVFLDFIDILLCAFRTDTYQHQSHYYIIQNKFESYKFLRMKKNGLLDLISSYITKSYLF